MTSAFASWTAFFAMGGYALYVWLSVFFTVAPLVILALYSWQQHRQTMREIITARRLSEEER
jgi:heme exporter protein D